MDIADALKTVIFPSNIKFRIPHSSRTVSMLVIGFEKLLSFSIFLLKKKWIPKILTVFNLKSTLFIPQSASLVPFCTSIPVTSHLDLLGFKLEKDENMSKTLITSTKDSLYFRKTVVPSAYVMYKIVCLNMLRLFVFLFFVFLSLKLE